MRKLMTGLVALALAACTDVPTYPLLDGETEARPIEIGHPPIIQHAPDRELLVSLYRADGWCELAPER